MPDENNDVIKTIVPNECPHRGGSIIIEFNTPSPKILSVYKVEDIEKAKNDAIARIEVLDIDEEKKVSVIKWIKDPTTVFGPSEVVALVDSLLKPE